MLHYVISLDELALLTDSLSIFLPSLPNTNKQYSKLTKSNFVLLLIQQQNTKTCVIKLQANSYALSRVECTNFALIVQLST